MDKLVLYIGCNVKNKHVHDIEDVQNAAIKTLQIAGATFRTAFGVWCGISETTVILEIIDNKKELQRVLSLVPKLATELQQNSIMQEYFADVNAQFIAAAPLKNKAVK